MNIAQATMKGGRGAEITHGPVRHDAAAGGPD